MHTQARVHDVFRLLPRIASDALLFPFCLPSQQRLNFEAAAGGWTRWNTPCKDRRVCVFSALVEDRRSNGKRGAATFHLRDLHHLDSHFGIVRAWRGVAVSRVNVAYARTVPTTPRRDVVCVVASVVFSLNGVCIPPSSLPCTPHLSMLLFDRCLSSLVFVFSLA